VTLAYLDPGSGSLIVSALIGGAAAAGVAAKQARARLSGFGRKKKADEQATPAVAEETAPIEAAADAVAEPADEATTVRSDT
jgi:hypothetical protein